MRKDEDYIIVCRDRSTGALSFFDLMGIRYMTFENASERAEHWARDYPHIAYTVVRIVE